MIWPLPPRLQCNHFSAVDPGQRKEQFSNAYVRAVVAAAGYTVNVPEVDDDSIDSTIHARGMGPAAIPEGWVKGGRNFATPHVCLLWSRTSQNRGRLAEMDSSISWTAPDDLGCREPRSRNAPSISRPGVYINSEVRLQLM